MAKYELIREIENNCSRNQMRDVFFSEIETANPALYVEEIVKGKEVHISEEILQNGDINIHVQCAGTCQKFMFTPLD